MKPGTKILITGGNGFLGRFITAACRQAGLGPVVLGRGKNVDIRCDLATGIPDLGGQTFGMVVHAAGKAHSVPTTAAEKAAFFQVNLEGTKHLCRSLEASGPLPKNFVFISTVAVYGADTGEMIEETHPLNGKSPYALSKIQAEAYLEGWCHTHEIFLTILRLPLIAGEGAPGNLEKMTRAVAKKRFFYFSGHNPRKSMVAADDVARLIPGLDGKSGIFNLTDGCHPSIQEVGAQIAEELHVSRPKTLPYFPFRIFATVGDYFGKSFPLNSATLEKLTTSLTFDDAKARKILLWSPRPVVPQKATPEQ